MAHVLCASPLVKVFLPEWHARLQRDKTLLTSMEPFEFIVNTGTTGLRVKFNTPQDVSLMGRRLTDEKEISTLHNWLIGDPSGNMHTESDCYGIVDFDPKIDISNRIDEMAMLEASLDGADKGNAKNEKKLMALRKDTKEKLESTRTAARELADKKVKNHMRIIYKRLQKQWQLNKMNNVGDEEPSIAEQLICLVLEDEIKKDAERGANLKQFTNELMAKNRAV